MTIIVWNCWGLGSSLAVRTLTDKVRTKDPMLVFLVKMKTRENRMNGIRNKLEYTQRITVPSEGRSGGLAMMWKEGTDVNFKSCSNLHIDVVVYRDSTSSP